MHVNSIHQYLKTHVGHQHLLLDPPLWIGVSQYSIIYAKWHWDVQSSLFKRCDKTLSYQHTTSHAINIKICIRFYVAYDSSEKQGKFIVSLKVWIGYHAVKFGNVCTIKWLILVCGIVCRFWICYSLLNPGTLQLYTVWRNGYSPLTDIKTVFPDIMIPTIKIRRSWDRVIFITELLYT